jgi:hypothetical protein
MLTPNPNSNTGTNNGGWSKISRFILVLFSCIALTYGSGGDVDIIYLNDGRVIKGEIIMGGKSSDYYVQIKTETEYLNFYMTDVREIKTSEAGVNKPPPVVKQKAQSVRADPSVKIIENIWQAKSDTQPSQQQKVQQPNRINIIGGITYSTFEGDDVKDAENLLGFSFGVEKSLANGLIAGATYSQRGSSSSYSESSEFYGGYSNDNELTLNYLTGYVLKPFPIRTGIDFLTGAELGYFLNGKAKSEYCYNGDCESNTNDIDGDDWEDMNGNNIDYGIVVGGKYTINKQISLVGTYFFGLANLNDDAEVNNRSFQIYFRYSL